MFITAIEARF